MIVRISGDEQYELADERAAELHELEHVVVGIVASGQEDGFKEAYARLIDYVRANGTVVADDSLAGSDVMLPPADISFAEAGKDFTGEGMIPD